MIKQGGAKETISSSFNCQFLLRCQSVVKPYRHIETAIHESICPVGSPKKHTPCLYPGHKQDRPNHSYQGVQVPVQARTLSPQHCRPGLSMVLRPPPSNIYNHPKKPIQKEPKPMTREKQVFLLP
jgi:hypothetical protein